MRRPIDAAEPVRHVLLGLLLDGPRHGYDLARAFAPSAPVGNVVHLAASHMYALLSQLERDGLITGECQEQGIRPPRRVYRITEAGCAVLSDWLDAPRFEAARCLAGIPAQALSGAADGPGAGPGPGAAPSTLTSPATSRIWSASPCKPARPPIRRFCGWCEKAASSALAPP